MDYDVDTTSMIIMNYDMLLILLLLDESLNFFYFNILHKMDYCMKQTMYLSISNKKDREQMKNRVRNTKTTSA